MSISRRQFIRQILSLGGSLWLLPSFLGAGDKPDAAHHYPAFARLESDGLFAGRIDEAYTILEECRLCPRECGVNRLAGRRGFCRAPVRTVVFSAHPHFGEEIALVGDGGSGTIFFSNCNLRCVFCQNWPIAHEGRGDEVDDNTLAALMLRLQEIGCHNINLVTPTHVMPNILKATRIALHQGLRIPLVYNTSGYERVDMLKLLDGIVDIYLPDMKYMTPDKAALYSAGAADYPEVTQKAVWEMHRQVGLLTTDSQGVALRGLIIRHLVMPNRVAGTTKFIGWVTDNLPKNTYINIMPQYHVDYKAYDYPEIARAITVEEFLEAIEWAETAGLTNLDPMSLAVRNVYQRVSAE